MSGELRAVPVVHLVSRRLAGGDGKTLATQI
jgi:hypothetical protein